MAVCCHQKHHCPWSGIGAMHGQLLHRYGHRQRPCASNGIEPAFSWVYNRKKRMAVGDARIYEVADHAWRLYRSMGNDVSDDSKLPSQFVTALNMSASDHMKMLQVVQPYIDSAISKTVNVPADYPYADF